MDDADSNDVNDGKDDIMLLKMMAIMTAMLVKMMAKLTMILLKLIATMTAMLLKPSIMKFYRCKYMLTKKEITTMLLKLMAMTMLMAGSTLP